MKLKLIAGWFCGALITVLSVWTLHSFLEAILGACVTAIASWPLYKRFTGRVPSMTRSTASLVFTSVMAVFVLAPLTFAFGALLVEGHGLLLQIAAADKNGIAAPQWLDKVPLAGPWIAAIWESQLAHPGAVVFWTQRTDPAALLNLAQSLGHFMARHGVIIAFAILVLFFLYQRGESLAEELRRLLRHVIGERADSYLELATSALRASVNSMLVVGLFDGFATWGAYTIAGVPHAAWWAAITGLLALVPFLGYVAVAALTLQVGMTGATIPALVSLGLGCVILFFGDKAVRPLMASGGTHLPFVWVLMGCLGGFEVLGLVGLVIGPVLLSLARELWAQRVRDLALRDATHPASAADGGVTTLVERAR
jgi:predicted PurR-regulated permease PerM